MPEAADGLFQTGVAPTARFDLSPPGVDALLASGEGWVRKWDSAAQAPFLWNPAKHIFASIEDEESAALKGKYVREHGLAGVMFWDTDLIRPDVCSMRSIEDWGERRRLWALGVRLLGVRLGRPGRSATLRLLTLGPFDSR